MPSPGRGGPPAGPYVACAGWSVPRTAQARFPAAGSHLERYAAVLPAVEINSSFYRPHRPSTYARWAASVPAAFRFAVKVPRTITHERRLRDAAELLEAFFAEIGGLGRKLGPLLVQLPPSLALDLPIAGDFFSLLRDRHDGPVVAEPRHPSWFEPAGEQLLVDHRIARVAADPPRVPAAAEPGGWPGIVYYRWHGSPRIYYSEYGAAEIARLAGRVRAARRAGVPAWCVFDNTALGAAAANALELLDRVRLAEPAAGSA